MGAWGPGIFEDDLAADVRGDFENLIAAGKPAADAVAELLREFAEARYDLDEGPVLVLALASLLVESGIREDPLVEQAREIFRAGAGLGRWEEAGPEALAERRAV